MTLKNHLVLTLFCAAITFIPAHAELKDQGLNSIMVIIDKAIGDIQAQAENQGEEADAARTNASNAIVNLSRTLGTLSYSRLQCGEASVLAEFTQRVLLVPEESRDAMRDAFQEGFDKSKDDTTLISEDECQRLTQSRNRTETETEANVTQDNITKPEKVEEEVVEVIEAEDPKFRHLRIAELTGQLAYKRKFCEDDTIFTRDYNQYIGSIPDEYQEDVKTAYWKGYKRGKRLNKGLTEDNC